MSFVKNAATMAGWRALAVLTLLPIGVASHGQAGQIAIDRVEMMPNQPQPYRLRDWRATARAYDRLAFDLDARGEYLPLLWWDDTKANGTGRAFGLPSYVGRDSKGGSEHEAITCLGALLGATVAGIDKTRGAYNWVRMAEAYYNRANGQRLVLNHTGTRAGGSFWYDLFPQVVFAQLTDRYPGVGSLDTITRAGADRWYDACVALGGSQGKLNFDHTAFDFTAMKPVDNGQWKEPDAAAAIAYLEYAAWRKWKDPRYLKAVDWCLGALERRADNPQYEILMSLAPYVAARMNAEAGRRYDTHKLLNWCFNPDSVVRTGWGVTVGRWGGYDCSGLAGSVTDGGGYAFAMNTFVLAGNLAPVARYDDRYARALGKWLLNAANAARLFYPDELPEDNQSGAAWQGDPAHGIAYEGLRREWNGVRPRAMGDPTVHGWAKTDFGLYGSSYVGLFAGLIARTDVEKILCLDLLATDFARPRAFPTYLYYNPYSTAKTVRLAVGAQPHDLYDATRNRFVARTIRGETRIALAADSAAEIVITPAGGKVTRERNRTLVNGVVIDYNNGASPLPAPVPALLPPDHSQTVRAPKVGDPLNGGPNTWQSHTGDATALDTAGRGTLRSELRFAWDERFLYLLVRETPGGDRPKEAPDAATYRAAPWDYQGVGLYLDAARGRIPSNGDLVLWLGFSSSGRTDLWSAPDLADAAASGFRVATGGSAAMNDRTIVARISWDALLDQATAGSRTIRTRLGRPGPGYRIGCQPLLVDGGWQRQSFLGGDQLACPSGRDANSRCILLVTK
jgi:hypothetical protein